MLDPERGRAVRRLFPHQGHPGGVCEPGEVNLARACVHALVGMSTAESAHTHGAQSCLRAAGCCSGKTTVLVARLLDAGGTERFVELYRNAAQQSCAEGFMLEDRRLLRAIEDLRGATPAALNIYLTQQPCHFSSSNDGNSCTERLLTWFQTMLKPRGVKRLRIAAAYPYRTHWSAAHMSEDDLANLGRRRWTPGGGRGGIARGWGRGGSGASGSSRGGGDRADAIARAHALLANAREGTRLLVSAPAEPEVLLDAFSEEDWGYIIGLCEPEVAGAFAAEAAPFSAEVKARRRQLDTFTRSVFDSFRGGDGGAAPS